MEIQLKNAEWIQNVDCKGDNDITRLFNAYSTVFLTKKLRYKSSKKLIDYLKNFNFEK